MYVEIKCQLDAIEVHLVGILFPHINDDARSKSHQISISTLMYTVWHVDKYKITFKLVINRWTNEILQHLVVCSGLSRPGG